MPAMWDTSVQGMRWQDMTNTLRLGVWPSFNRPYFRDIYEKAGCAWRCVSTYEYSRVPQSTLTTPCVLQSTTQSL